MMGDAFLYGMLRLLKQGPEDEGQMRRALESFLELMCGILRQDAAEIETFRVWKSDFSNHFLRAVHPSLGVYLIIQYCWIIR